LSIFGLKTKGTRCHVLYSLLPFWSKHLQHDPSGYHEDRNLCELANGTLNITTGSYDFRAPPRSMLPMQEPSISPLLHPIFLPCLSKLVLSLCTSCPPASPILLCMSPAHLSTPTPLPTLARLGIVIHFPHPLLAPPTPHCAGGEPYIH
jgi:hypothetical protein